MRRERIAGLAWGLAGIGLVLAGLEAAVASGWVARALLPPPSSVAVVLGDLVWSGAIFPPLAATLLRLAAGLAAGGSLAVLTGLAMGYSPLLHDLLEPLVETIRPLPKSALVPALILFLGLGEAMKVTSVALAAFFPVLVATIQGVRGVDPVLVATARSFGHSRLRILLRIVLPAALPFVLAGLRIGIGLGLVLATLSEMLAGTDGVGFLILDMQRGFRIRQMYAWIVILGFTGLLLNGLFLALERGLSGCRHDPAGTAR